MPRVATTGGAKDTTGSTSSSPLPEKGDDRPRDGILRNRYHLHWGIDTNSRRAMANRNVRMTDMQAAKFIRDHAKTLRMEAKGANFDMLVYLLEMAVVEAEGIVSRLRSEEQRKRKA